MMPTTITPSHTTRKSGRTVRKPSRMDDDVDTPNMVGIVVPLRHDLIAPKESIRTLKSNKYRFAVGSVRHLYPVLILFLQRTYSILQVHPTKVSDTIVRIITPKLTCTTSGCHQKTIQEIYKKK